MRYKLSGESMEIRGVGWSGGGGGRKGEGGRYREIGRKIVILIDIMTELVIEADRHNDRVSD